MGKNRWTILIQCCVCLWLPVGHTDCPYTECYCNGGIVSCSFRNLQALPQLVDTNGSTFWSLEITSNNISRIPGGGLPPNLKELDLNENPITIIDDNAFDESASTLATVYLDKVLFSQFPNAFGHLRALTSLSISNGNITDWNDVAWINIGQTLQTLDIENVGITEWPSLTGHCTQLNYLTISGNSFSSIPDGALDSVAKCLTSLDLSYNRLTTVPKALSNLYSLQTLHLQNNHVTDVRWLPQNSKLNTLSLSLNYISNATQLSEVLRPYNTSLSAFGIDNNHLTSIPDISYLVNARSLDLSYNKISDSLSGDVAPDAIFVYLSYNLFPYIPKMLTRLLIVNTIALSNNAIRAIRDTDFHENITAINLGYNLITEVTDTSFPNNFGLQELDLNNNPLTRISSVALQHLPSLTYLDISYTKLTRLPLGLPNLKSLIYLDINNSTMLVCTCMESSLTSFMKTLQSQNVRGNCGQTSVYDFFSILGPSCPSLADNKE